MGLNIPRLRRDEVLANAKGAHFRPPSCLGPNSEIEAINLCAARFAPLRCDRSICLARSSSGSTSTFYVNARRIIQERASLLDVRGRKTTSVQKNR
jgi:hypothetical protein